MIESKQGARQLGAMGWPITIMAVLLVVTPLLQVAAALGSFRPDSVGWRFGAVGLLSGSLLTPLLGIFMAVLAAHLLGKRVLLRILSIIAMLAAMGVIAMLLLFALDALQMHASVAPNFMRPWWIATGQSIFNQTLALLALSATGLSGWRASRRPHTERAAAVQAQKSSLLVRSPAGEQA